MDILKVIKKDHDAAKAIFKKLDGQTEKASRETRNLVEQLVVAIRVHAKSEEAALYSALDERTKVLREFSLEGYHEHELLDEMLGKLLDTKPGEDGEFAAVLKVAYELFHHHAVEDEEQDLFAKVRHAFTLEEREEMGIAMKKMEAELKPSIEAKVHGTAIAA